jgi:hypothetical protein
MYQHIQLTTRRPTIIIKKKTYNMKIILDQFIWNGDLRMLEATVFLTYRITVLNTMLDYLNEIKGEMLHTFQQDVLELKVTRDNGEELDNNMGMKEQGVSYGDKLKVEFITVKQLDFKFKVQPAKWQFAFDMEHTMTIKFKVTKPIYIMFNNIKSWIMQKTGMSEVPAFKLKTSTNQILTKQASSEVTLQTWLDTGLISESNLNEGTIIPEEEEQGDDNDDQQSNDDETTIMVSMVVWQTDFAGMTHNWMGNFELRLNHTIQDLKIKVRNRINQEQGVFINFNVKLNDNPNIINGNVKIGDLKTQGLLTNDDQGNVGHDTFFAVPLNNDQQEEGGDNDDNEDNSDTSDDQEGFPEDNDYYTNLLLSGIPPGGTTDDEEEDTKKPKTDLADTVQQKEDYMNIQELFSNFHLIKVEAWANKITDNTPTETAFANYNTTVGELMEDMGCNIRDNILYYNGKPWPHYRRVQEMAGTNKEVKVIIKGTGLLGGAGNKRARDNDDEDKPNMSAQKGMDKDDRLEMISNIMDKLIAELEQYEEDDQLIHDILEQVKNDKEQAELNKDTCLTNVLKTMHVDKVETLEDNTSNLPAFATKIAKQVYKTFHKQIKEYEDMYASVKKLLDNLLLYAITLQYHKGQFVERNRIKEDIKKLVKDMSKEAGKREANRMQP